MPEAKIAIYPGTFDPITTGHSDIIRRAAYLVDRLVIGIAVNQGKNPMFSAEDRVQMVQDEVAYMSVAETCEIDVCSFSTLLTHFARECQARMIFRGLRAVSDFDYEFQMVGMNARLSPDIETVFLMASETQQFISSRFVKEIASLQGDVSSFVSPRVLKRIHKHLGVK